MSPLIPTNSRIAATNIVGLAAAVSAGIGLLRTLFLAILSVARDDFLARAFDFFFIFLLACGGNGACAGDFRKSSRTRHEEHGPTHERRRDFRILCHLSLP